MTGSRNVSGMNRDLTRFERSSGLVSGGLKINRKVVGFLQRFLQGGLQLKRIGPPELETLAGLMMSGRLDSNQRPPEPHSAGRSRKEPFFRGIPRSAVSSYYEFYGVYCLLGRFLLPLLPCRSPLPHFLGAWSVLSSHASRARCHWP